MKCWFILAPLTVLLAGCNPGDGGLVQQKPVNRQIASQMVEFLAPSTTVLPNGRRRLALGEQSEKALIVFPRPSRGFPIEESVPGLPETFKSIGWESSSDGFGAVVYEGQVVMAMRQFEALDAEQFAQTLESVQSANPALKYSFTTVGNVDFWSGSDSITTLVISRIPTKAKTYQCTISLGESHLMNTMGLIPANGVQVGVK